MLKKKKSDKALDNNVLYLFLSLSFQVKAETLAGVERYYFGMLIAKNKKKH